MVIHRRTKELSSPLLAKILYLLNVVLNCFEGFKRISLFLSHQINAEMQSDNLITDLCLDVFSASPGQPAAVLVFPFVFISPSLDMPVHLFPLYFPYSFFIIWITYCLCLCLTVLLLLPFWSVLILFVEFISFNLQTFCATHPARSVYLFNFL